MPIPIPLKKHFEIIEEARVDLKELFSVPTTPPRERWIRSYAAPVASRLPLSIQYELTSMMKKLRNPTKELKLIYPLDFQENQNVVEDIIALDAKPWWGKKAVVCLCHDVDNKKGSDFVSQMAQMNIDHDVHSTFNFLTHADYALDQKLLKRLHQDGFEIGLHGVNHDQGFAFRTPAKIRAGLMQALEALDDFEIKGYRSPALSLSSNLFYALSDQGILYDSSLQISSPFYYSVRLPYPYYLEEYGIWELPLMVQDDNYFRDTETSEEAIFESLNRFVEEVKQLNGVFVLNMHPHLMVDRPLFYKKFLCWIQDKELAIKTAQEVITYIQESNPVSAY